MSNKTTTEFKIIFNDLTPEIITELSLMFERLKALDQLPNVNCTYFNGCAIPMPFPHQNGRYFDWFTRTE